MNNNFKVALKMSTLNPDGKVTKGQNIITSIQSNPSYFPVAGLPFPIATMAAAVTALHSAILASANGAQASISHMHEKERSLTALFNVLKAHVEMLANNSTDPQTIIEAAGMSVAKTRGSNSVSELTVTALGNGTIQVSVPRRNGEAAFIYYYSDDGGNTWKEFEWSKLAIVQLKKQVPASILHFKYLPIAKTKGEMSQPKSTIVL